MNRRICEKILKDSRRYPPRKVREAERMLRVRYGRSARRDFAHLRGMFPEGKVDGVAEAYPELDEIIR